MEILLTWRPLLMTMRRCKGYGYQMFPRERPPILAAAKDLWLGIRLAMKSCSTTVLVGWASPAPAALVISRALATVRRVSVLVGHKARHSLLMTLMATARSPLLTFRLLRR